MMLRIGDAASIECSFCELKAAVVAIGVVQCPIEILLNLPIAQWPRSSRAFMSRYLLLSPRAHNIRDMSAFMDQDSCSRPLSFSELHRRAIPKLGLGASNLGMIEEILAKVHRLGPVIHMRRPPLLLTAVQ